VVPSGTTKGWVGPKNVTRGIIWKFEIFCQTIFFSTIQLKQLDCATWWRKIMPHGNLKHLAL